MNQNAKDAWARARVDVHMPADERRRRIDEGIALIVEQDSELLAKLARQEDTMTYGIDDDYGNVLYEGLSEHEAELIAQKEANRLGRVWLYEEGNPSPARAIEPEEENQS
jgi:hypothetical protein